MSSNEGPTEEKGERTTTEESSSNLAGPQAALKASSSSGSIVHNLKQHYLSNQEGVNSLVKRQQNHSKISQRELRADSESGSGKAKIMPPSNKSHASIASHPLDSDHCKLSSSSSSSSSSSINTTTDRYQSREMARFRQQCCCSCSCFCCCGSMQNQSNRGPKCSLLAANHTNINDSKSHKGSLSHERVAIVLTLTACLFSLADCASIALSLPELPEQPSQAGRLQQQQQQQQKQHHHHNHQTNLFKQTNTQQQIDSTHGNSKHHSSQEAAVAQLLETASLLANNEQKQQANEMAHFATPTETKTATQTETEIDDADDEIILLVLAGLSDSVRRQPEKVSLRRHIKRSGISDQRLAEIQMIRALKKQLERASKLAIEPSPNGTQGGSGNNNNNSGAEQSSAR